jgi:hypothetical protein
MATTANIAREHTRGHYPARSKMLDMYVGDVGRMLADGRHEAAEAAALPLPHIAIALSEAALQSSCAAYHDWCARWIQPDFGAAAYEDWCRRSGLEGSARSVPFEALRALRLRRWAREVAAPLPPADSADQLRNPERVTCALLGAAFRWYEQEGRYDPVVQSNVARLGVLR